ncbi:MAG: type III secretion inner membrane ring lipoprotein SctJ [Parachlamydiaceae bacterium]|nr:type III secretion inner membrane ring lipoprotein SctJ [Parachlamydiaceae bacterium]
MLCQFCFLALSLSLFTSCSSTKIIVNNLDENEANEIIVFLASKGMTASKVQAESAGGGANKVVMWNIQVNEAQATDAMGILNQAGLPRRRGQNLLNIFAGGGLVPSELQEKIRYQAGLAEQIASTIRKIDGVLDAEVQISFPEEDPLNPGKSKGKITSSVYVKHSGVLDDPNAHLTQKIKRLVAASITGLDYDNVTVISDRARYNPSTIGVGEEEKQYLSIWTLIIAKESVTRFRIIFFSFILLVLGLLLALIWFAWKTYPLLKNHGGIRELFHMHPIAVEPKAPPVDEAAKKEEEAKSAKAKKAEGDSQVDQEIDEI